MKILEFVVPDHFCKLSFRIIFLQTLQIDVLDNHFAKIFKSAYCHKNFPLYLKNFQMCGQTWVAKALLLLPLASTQKLGAGTGSGSCRAFPYRVENVSVFFSLFFFDKQFQHFFSGQVDWEVCPPEVPCCNEYGYCRTKVSPPLLLSHLCLNLYFP